MPAHSKEIDSVVLVANFIANEVPSGTIDSSNKVFILAHTPVIGTVQVYLNGMVQYPGLLFDYTISIKTITFNKAPRTNSEIVVHYIRI